MKALKIVVFLLFASQTIKAQASFGFNDCLNKWSDFNPSGSLMNVRAAYISNSAGRNWCIQIMNTNDQTYTFFYTVYGATGHFSKSITINGHGVSPVTIVSVNACCAYGTDIFVSCGPSPGMNLQYKAFFSLAKKKP